MCGSWRWDCGRVCYLGRRKTEDSHSLGFLSACKLRVKSEVAVSWASSKRTGGYPNPQRQKSHHLSQDTQRRSAAKEGELEGVRGRGCPSAPVPGRYSVERPLHSVGQKITRRPPPWQGQWGGSGKLPGRNSAAVTRPRAGQALLGVSRAASPPQAGAPRAAPPNPVSPAETQRHRPETGSVRNTPPTPTEPEPAETMLRSSSDPVSKSHPPNHAL